MKERNKNKMPFNIMLNLNNFFDFDSIEYVPSYELYILYIVSQVTGEVFQIPLNEDYMDKLLECMELNLISKRLELINITGEFFE